MWYSFLIVNWGRDLPRYIKTVFSSECAHVRKVSPVPSRLRLATSTEVLEVVVERPRWFFLVSMLTVRKTTSVFGLRLRNRAKSHEQNDWPVIPTPPPR